jgi:hypothetical protein
MHGYEISMNTCGVTLKKRLFLDSNPVRANVFRTNDIKVEFLAHMKNIYTSIYGDEGTHNEITGVKSFQDTLQLLSIARIMFSRLPDKNPDDVVINTPIFSAEQVKGLIHLFSTASDVLYKDNGQVRFGRKLFYPIHFIRLLSHGRAKNLDVLSREEQLAIAMRYKNQFGNDVRVSQSLLHEKCNWKNKLTLLPNGRLIHCVAGKWSKNPNREFVCDYTE